jgi:phosphate starvation-inducible protein PhoH and related proteins
MSELTEDKNKYRASFEIGSQEEALGLFGHRDENLKYIERETGVKFRSRNGEVAVEGRRSREVAELMQRLLEDARRGKRITGADVKYGLMLLDEDDKGREGKKDFELKLADSGGRAIKPTSPRQRDYLEAISKYDMVFSVGPAGTGKTYLAVAMAVKALQEESVKRIVICRPAVEAGEKLGFLPGDMQQKVDPYLRPIYDALFAMMHADRCARYLERGTIEVAPLAYMRGRTLDDAFVIMDEAQNTSVEQMKMFLTRLGRRSRAVITGDVTQIDLPPEKVSGLVDAVRRLQDIEGVSFVFFTHRDVVRHDLVAKIIKAYEHGDSSEREKAEEIGEEEQQKEED